MNNPISEMRNFKKDRCTASNNPIHHARASEAQVEVTIETESETLTCEINTMQNNNNNVEQIRPSAASDVNIDGVKAEMNNLAGAIKEALDNPTPAAEETNMEQTETISITSVTDRYKKLRRNIVIGAVVGAATASAGVVAGAALNGRDVKNAAIISGAAGVVSAGLQIVSRRHKADAQAAAELMSEEAYQQSLKVNKKAATIGTAIALGVGMLVGAFCMRKVSVGE